MLAVTGELRYILHRVEDVTELVHATEMTGRTRSMEREVMGSSDALQRRQRLTVPRCCTLRCSLAKVDGARRGPPAEPRWSTECFAS